MIKQTRPNQTSKWLSNVRHSHSTAKNGAILEEADVSNVLKHCYFHAIPYLKIYIKFHKNVSIICPRVFLMSYLNMRKIIRPAQCYYYFIKLSTTKPLDNH